MLVREGGEHALGIRYGAAGRVLEQFAAIPEALHAYCRAQEWDEVDRLLHPPVPSAAPRIAPAGLGNRPARADSGLSLAGLGAAAGALALILVAVVVVGARRRRTTYRVTVTVNRSASRSRRRP